MLHRLFIVEGLPCSGKSTISAYLAKVLSGYRCVSFVDEGTGNHPADYESHAFVPAGLVSEQEQIVGLSAFSPDIREKLLPYKIYDGLAWEAEAPLMLDKWRSFVKSARNDTTYVFNCVFLQNPMCETMMRFGFALEESYRYIAQIMEIIKSMNPVILYLKNDDIADSVRKAACERPGWLDAVIDYHVNGAYGKCIGAQGFDGYIECLKERQRRELQILSALKTKSYVLDNPQRNWLKARADIDVFCRECEGIE